MLCPTIRLDQQLWQRYNTESQAHRKASKRMPLRSHINSPMYLVQIRGSTLEGWKESRLTRLHRHWSRQNDLPSHRNIYTTDSTLPMTSSTYCLPDPPVFTTRCLSPTNTAVSHPLPSRQNHGRHSDCPSVICIGVVARSLESRCAVSQSCHQHGRSDN